jgi:ribosome-associated protein
MIDLSTYNLAPELEFSSSRSGGKGGQNVNKVETKIELTFDVQNSKALSDKEKQVIMEKLSNRIDKEGKLRVVSQKHRSQIQNRAETVKKFYELLEKAFKPVKKRVKTKVPKSVNEKRIEEKKKTGEKKKMRTKPIKINGDN